jgi:hypothetical protein
MTRYQQRTPWPVDPLTGRPVMPAFPAELVIARAPCTNQLAPQWLRNSADTPAALAPQWGRIKCTNQLGRASVAALAPAALVAAGVAALVAMLAPLAVAIGRALVILQSTFGG